MAGVSAAYRHMARSGRPWRARKSESTRKTGDAECLWSVFNIGHCYTCVSSPLISFIDVTSWQQWCGKERNWATYHSRCQWSSGCSLQENVHGWSAGASHPQLLYCTDLQTVWITPMLEMPAVATGASAKVFLCTFSIYKGLQTLICILSFFPRCPVEEGLWVPRAGHFGSTRDLFPPPVTQLPCMQGSTGRAKFPDRPILAQISTSQRHVLQELSSHSRVTHFFSVP